MKGFILAGLYCFFGINAIAQSANILLDEEFSDWENFSISEEDTTGDGRFLGVDFKKVQVAHDAEWLYFRIQTGAEINLQENNKIRLQIDTDNNANTGISVDGAGIDFQYDFGALSGRAYVHSRTYNIRHDDIFLVIAPSVTSDEFELAFRRDISFGGQQLFSGDAMRFFIEDVGADRVPDGDGSILYGYENESAGIRPEFSIRKQTAAQLRIVSWNVRRDGIFETSKRPALSRLLQALQPDIIAFQEIYDHSSQQTANLVGDILPANWFHERVSPDIILLSRFPLIQSTAIQTNGAFLIKIAEDKNLLLINAHTPCCENDAGRQDEIDAFMAFIRDAKNGLGPLPIAANTPIIITGDMNLVGLRRQLETLTSGDLVYENRYGPDFLPDWDGSPLEDAKPFSTGLPMTFTWRSTGSSFNPGRLDVMIYTDAVMQLKNSFTLFTGALPWDTLQAYGLQPSDAGITSDHLPLVGDFELKTTSRVNESESWTSGMQVFPNPFHEKLSIKIPDEVEMPQAIHFSLHDVYGRKMLNITGNSLPNRNRKIELSTSTLPPGIYFLLLKTEKDLLMKKVIKK